MMSSSRLASYLASRIFHDLVSPLTALINGASLVFDDDMGLALRAEGEALMKDGLASLEAKIQFLRYALGSQALSEGEADVHGARRLFEKLFSVHKAALSWEVGSAAMSHHQMRLLMNMTLLMMEPAAKSGTVRVCAVSAGGGVRLEVETTGLPGELKKEVLEGLAGEEPERGWGGGAIQPFFTRVLADEIDFSLTHAAVPRGVRLTAAPAGSPYQI
jgi:histidine phosphotransferase ChpT